MDVNVLSTEYLEWAEDGRIVAQLVENKGKKYLSLNKQWRDKTGNWQFGKGFWTPFEEAANLAFLVLSLLGIEIEVK